MYSSLHDLAYSDRLRTLGALSLENKMFHADMSTVYKSLHHGFNCTADDLGLSFMNSNKTRVGVSHLVQKVTRSSCVSVFKYRVPPVWIYKSKANITHAPTLSSFKKHLLKVLLYSQ